MSARTIVLDEPAVAHLRRGLYAAEYTRGPYRRPTILSGVLLDGDRAVCSDSYRMTVTYFDGRPLPRVLVDAKPLGRLLPKRGDWTVSTADLPVVLCDDQRLTADVYPDYQKVLRSLHWQYTFTIPRDALLDGLNSLPREKKDTYVTAGLLPSGVHVSDAYDSHLQADGWEQAMSVTGRDEQPTYVNAHFLRDLARACTTDHIAFECDGEHRPVIVRQPGITHLLMPVRYMGTVPS